MPAIASPGVINWITSSSCRSTEEAGSWAVPLRVSRHTRAPIASRSATERPRTGRGYPPFEQHERRRRVGPFDLGRRAAARCATPGRWSTRRMRRWGCPDVRRRRRAWGRRCGPRRAGHRRSRVRRGRSGCSSCRRSSRPSRRSRARCPLRSGGPCRSRCRSSSCPGSPRPAAGTRPPCGRSPRPHGRLRPTRGRPWIPTRPHPTTMVCMFRPPRRRRRACGRAPRRRRCAVGATDFAFRAKALPLWSHWVLHDVTNSGMTTVMMSPSCWASSSSRNSQDRPGELAVRRVHGVQFDRDVEVVPLLLEPHPFVVVARHRDRQEAIGCQRSCVLHAVEHALVDAADEHHHRVGLALAASSPARRRRRHAPCRSGGRCP